MGGGAAALEKERSARNKVWNAHNKKVYLLSVSYKNLRLTDIEGPFHPNFHSNLDEESSLWCRIIYFIPGAYTANCIMYII